VYNFDCLNAQSEFVNCLAKNILANRNWWI